MAIERKLEDAKDQSTNAGTDTEAGSIYIDWYEHTDKA